jgi:hypothetical protein
MPQGHASIPQPHRPLSTFSRLLITLSGTAIGLGLWPVWLEWIYFYDHGFGESAKSMLVGGIGGTLAGALCAYIASAGRHRTP